MATIGTRIVIGGIGITGTDATSTSTTTGATMVVTAVKTSTYTAAANDIVQCDPTSAGFSIKLPASSSSSNAQIIVKNVSGSANPITITPNGADTIDGASTYVISSPRLSVLLVSDGSGNWNVI